MMIPVAVCACTSVIISGSASPDGRPIMWKHRDTGFLDNRLEHFKGEKYSFIGLVNSEEGPLGREVWIGTNTAGFSIMNTASYCLKNDDVPASEMDREGVLMYRALEICADLSDFEHFLDTLSRPMGVEANFGCIDAFGGAAYYETWNDGYVKRDVTEMEDGYCVVTNFSVTGRKKDWKGVERYRTASEIFASMEKEGSRFRCIGPDVIMNFLSNGIKYAFSNTELNLQIYGIKNMIGFEFMNESPYIPEERRKSLFDQYVSYASAHNELGIGLGLYASKKIIDGHKGKIFVESYKNNRNSFGFRIPVVQKNNLSDRFIQF